MDKKHCPGMLTHMLLKLLLKFSDQEIILVAGFWRRTLNMRYATGCSGAETPSIVFRAIVAALSILTGKPVPLPKHIFACEMVPAKCAWIHAVAPLLELIFMDITELGSAESKDWITGTMKPIPKDFECFFAGFSCKDYSALNNNRADNHNNISAGVGTSGSTFHGVTLALKTSSTQYGILENVAGLKGKGMQDVISQLRQDGFLADFFELNALDFFLPQSRIRVYIWFIKTSLFSENYSEDEVTACMNGIMARLQAGNFQVSIDDLLVRETDPRIMTTSLDAFIKINNGSAFRESLDVCAGKRKWFARHETASALRHEDWLDNYVALEEVGEVFPGYLRLLPRQRDALATDGISIPLRPPVILDLSQSQGRSGARGSVDGPLIAPCVTPNGELYHSGLVRLFLGEEQLALQGIFVERYITDMFTQRLLGDLAGNAFCATCFGAAHCALTLTMAKIQALLPLTFDGSDDMFD